MSNSFCFFCHEGQIQDFGPENCGQCEIYFQESVHKGRHFVIDSEIITVI